MAQSKTAVAVMAVAVVFAACFVVVDGVTATATKKKHHSSSHHNHHVGHQVVPQFMLATPPAGMFGLAGMPTPESMGLTSGSSSSAAGGAGSVGAGAMRFAQVGLGAKSKSKMQSPGLPEVNTDRDFVRAIYNLLSTSRDANVADNSKLRQQKIEAERKEQELKRREGILRARAAMLTRLQYCLEKDTPGSSTSTTKSNSTSANNKDIAARLAKLEQELEARRKQVEAMAKDLADREAALRNRIQVVDNREKEVAKMAASKAAACPCLNQKAARPATVQHPEATARPANSEQKPCAPGSPQPCAAPQPSMPVVPMNPIKAQPCAAQAPPKMVQAKTCSCGAGRAARGRRRLAGGKSRRTFHVKAKKGGATKKKKAATTKKMRFKAAAPTASAQKKQKQVSNVTPKATFSTTGTCPSLCGAYRSCGLCVADSNCGWCSSTQKCSPVNEGKATCDAADYSIMYCREHSCAQHTYCRSCMADPKCGLCASTGKCGRGGITGPAQGTCNNWSYATGLRFLTFNIYGRDTSNSTARAAIIFKMLERANADFVALQEVEDWFLELLAREKWAANYHMSDFGSGHAPGGLLVLSKVPLLNVAYYEKTEPGQVEVDQRGRMLVVHPKMGQGNFALATTTLDWRSAENRAESMKYMFSVLNVTSDVVMMGDFNFDSNAQPETAAIPYNFEDVWQSLRPHHLGYTWDPKSNAYARTSDPSSRPSRIDRVLVKSGFWEARQIQKIGSPDASPHYGLLAQLEMFGAYC